MRTEGFQLSFPDSGSRLDPVCKRQDTLLESNRKTQEQEHGSFNDLYKRIAGSNKESRTDTEKSVESKNVRNCKEDDERENISETSAEEETYLAMLEQLGIASDSEVNIANNKQASETIQEALVNISQELQFHIDKGIDQLNFTDEIPEDSVNYLTEILALLKDIIGCLDSASVNNEPVEIGNKIITPEMNEEVCGNIRKNMFMIEMGLNTLGISSDVAQKLSELTDNGFAGNIPQALNPSELSMPHQQAQKLFDDIVVNPDKEVESLVKKISSLILNNTEPKTTSTNVLEKFDTQTYRQMLKLENGQKNGAEMTVSENTEAAKGNEKMNIPSVTDALATNVNQLDNSVDEVMAVSNVLSTKSVATNNIPVLETKLFNALGRTLDDSVMSQVSEKLNIAVRSGINEVRIQLRPEALGDVKCQIRMEGDIVIVKFQVENQQVKQIIESNMQSLKDTLAQQNLQAGSFDVDVGGNNWSHQEAYADRNSSFKGQKGNSEDSDLDNGTDEADTVGVSLGAETGRRYGNNSVEYFG